MWYDLGPCFLNILCVYQYTRIGTYILVVMCIFCATVYNKHVHAGIYQYTWVYMGIMGIHKYT